MSSLNIPVVDFSLCGLNNAEKDLSEKNLESTGVELVKALSTVGVSYLTNSGIDPNMICDGRKVWEKFFDSSLEKKSKYARGEDVMLGYIGHGTEHVDCTKPADHKEAYNITCKSVSSGTANLPDDLSPGITDWMKIFMSENKALTDRIFDLLSLLFAIYNQAMCGWDATQTDYCTITILFTDDVGGLQFDKNGEFVDIVPMPNVPLVYVEDTLQGLTSGQLKAIKNRDVVSADKMQHSRRRLSMGYYVIPDDEVPINRPLLYKDEKINQVNQKALSSADPPLTFPQHLANMAAKIRHDCGKREEH
ncbi:unnamed protein product [Clavelina lepadiformis]|uniref:Uncharacterized protein n=1 Tax=Clavelina lepadiformis TaxID=159417 RepID=A0ABP0GS03_CLALP